MTDEQEKRSVKPHGCAAKNCRGIYRDKFPKQEKGQPEGWPNSLIQLVGARRFELPTPCTPCKYATRLRYAPTNCELYQRVLTFWHRNLHRLPGTLRRVKVTLFSFLKFPIAKRTPTLFALM
jgi:hypothetical protein